MSEPADWNNSKCLDNWRHSWGLDNSTQEYRTDVIDSIQERR